MKIPRSQFVFICASVGVLLILFLMIWAMLLILQRPDAGASWSFTSGVVEQISPGGPSQGILELGDTILTLDGLPVRQARGYPGRSAGDIISLLVERNHQTINLEVRLAPPGTLVTLDRLTPMIIALAFWILSVLVLIYGQPQNFLVILYGLAAASTLTLGSLSFFGPFWTSVMFDFILWWDGPLTVHTHLQVFHGRYGKKLTFLVVSLYSLALPFSLLSLLTRIGNIGLDASTMQLFTYCWLGLNFVMAFGLSVFTQKSSSQIQRPQRRLAIMALGVAAGVLPLLVFSLLPDALFGSTFLPYELAFIFMITLPLGYGIVVFEDRIPKVSRMINRAIGYGLILVVITAIYMLIYYGVIKIFQTQERTILLTSLFVTLVLMASAHPIFRWVRGIGEIVLYGDSFDYQTTLRTIEKSLANAEMTPQSIGKMLCTSLVQNLNAEFVDILLADGSMQEVQIGHYDNPITVRFPPKIAQDIIIQKKELPSTVIEIELPVDEKLVVLAIKKKKTKLIIPLKCNGRSHGLLFIGPRRGFRGYDQTALTILESITHQAQIAIDNAYLLEEVKAKAAQAARVHRLVIQAREDERKRIARDLHDQTIQELVGMNFQLAELCYEQTPWVTEKATQLQARIRLLSQQLRQVCADLRPPALDTIGLIPAIRSRITSFKQLSPIQVSFGTSGNLDQQIPEEYTIYFYRVLQELLQNIRKHSSANQIDVWLDVGKERIILTVKDDGHGFIVPEQLEALAKDRHFGLLGLQEMLEPLGGKLFVQSSPGKGCIIRAILRLTTAVEESNRLNTRITESEEKQNVD